MDAFTAYLFLINATAFFLMLSDKARAKKNLWRIPENTLLAVAALGGSLGAVIGMNLFRHKTRKMKFSLGLPVLLILHILILTFLRH